MQLYFVFATDDDDATLSLDLFVTAESPAQALSLWREWAARVMGSGCSYPTVFVVPPPAVTPTVHEWHTPGGVERVA